MYACLEACPLKKSDIRSLDFVVDRFFIKLFNTNNIDIDIIRSCHEHVLNYLATSFSRVPRNLKTASL